MKNNTEVNENCNNEQAVSSLSITDVLALLIIWAAVLAILALCNVQGFIVGVGLLVACYLSTMIITKKPLLKFWN
jgi:preprotein translocase subunit SecD